MDIKYLYELYKKSNLVDTDTRNIRKNSLFFALKGENFNGNLYANEAIKKGANFAIVDEKKFVTNNQIIYVENVLVCLQQLANYHRNQLRIPIIALTGSNGKTTTKELINKVLSTKFNTLATRGNLNNHIGVPLTLLSMNDKTEIGIVEMGANHINEIAFLCDIAEPNFGYITNFGKAHLEGFGSLKGVIKGKSELYEFLKKSNGIVFMNANDPIQEEKTKGMDIISFGNNENDIQITFLKADPFVDLEFGINVINSKLVGKYNYLNIAAAVTIGNYFKIDHLKIKAAIESYIPSNNRSQIIEKGKFKIILDAYNANPSSMEAALENFDKDISKNKTVILGDMFELGMEAKKEHQIISELATSLTFNTIILIGSNFFEVDNDACLKFDSFESFKKTFPLNKLTSTDLLIKGSRGMALERIINLI